MWFGKKISPVESASYPTMSLHDLVVGFFKVLAHSGGLSFVFSVSLLFYIFYASIPLLQSVKKKKIKNIHVSVSRLTSEGVPDGQRQNSS